MPGNNSVPPVVVLVEDRVSLNLLLLALQRWMGATAETLELMVAHLRTYGETLVVILNQIDPADVMRWLIVRGCTARGEVAVPRRGMKG